MIPGRLRLRFVVAAGLLVLTTVMASVWTFFALSRLSGIVTDTVRQSESVTAVTSRLAGALEREDDAVLLILAGDDRGTRGAGDESVPSWIRPSPTSSVSSDRRTSASSPARFKRSCSAYRQAADGVISVRARTGSARRSITRRPIPSCAARSR